MARKACFENFYEKVSETLPLRRRLNVFGWKYKFSQNIPKRLEFKIAIY